MSRVNEQRIIVVSVTMTPFFFKGLFGLYKLSTIQLSESRES